jgi:CRP-like cAMP-binding protein
VTDQVRRADEARSNGAGAAMADALARSDLLPGIGAAGFLAIRDELMGVHLQPGDQLVGRGEVADHLFVVREGQMEVILETAQGTQQLALLQEGVVIGEIGLLAGDRRSATVRAVTECELTAVSAEGVRRLLADHPRHAEDLARQATERLRRTQLIEHFTNLIGVIDKDVLDTIEQVMEWITVPAGTCLFSEGDDGDAAYLVATGRLRVFRRNDAGVDVETGEVGQAELVGEMSLIDGEPRGASAYAVRDCQLMRFSRAAYEELLHTHPRVGLDIAQMALRRTRSDGKPNVSRDRHLSFVLVPASPSVDVRAFADRLATAFGEGAAQVSSATLDRDLGREGIAQIDDDDVGALRLAYRMEELEQLHRFLILEIDAAWTPWSRRALRWADHVLLVADAGDDPRPGPLERELWSMATRQHRPQISLALVHPPATHLPSGTAAWLETRPVASHHHLRHGDDAQMARLARLLSGSGTSLVLGGGGARGFAHIGVLSVMEELGAPIDMVGRV